MKNINRFFFTAGFALILSQVSSAQTKWNPDYAHSSIKFTTTHLVISEVEGSFKSFNGSMEASKSDFTDAKINFTADVSSINTDNEKRDGHLKSDDFFNAEKYPKITFKSKSFKKIKDNKYQLKGELTIRDVTKPVTFDVTYGGTAKDPWGNTHVAFKATTKINRFDYNLKWNTLTEAGGAVVGKDIEVKVNIEFLPEKK
ncbi:MAG: YceI family protein [Bacteroidetes bacterium]|nr:YceI family protein [Bacteroidota bacterium]